MKNSMLAVGDQIKVRCGKCRKTTDHSIVAMIENDSVEVQCNTCKRRHEYQPSITTKKPALRQTADPKIAERKEWVALRPSMNGPEAINYSMAASYKVKTLINHPVFGLGLVQRVVGPQKIEVLFEDGKKTMRCK